MCQKYIGSVDTERMCITCSNMHTVGILWDGIMCAVKL